MISHALPLFDHNDRVSAGELDVSVIIGSYQGATKIGGMLRALAAQTLPRSRFEIVVVLNGSRHHTIKVINEIREDHPDLIIRHLSYSALGLGRARNAGMAMARGRYVTFVDDDDTVSPGYLEALLTCSAPDTVGLAHLADVHGSGVAPNFDTRMSRQLELAGRTLHISEIPVALTYSVGKMLPTALAREIGFDPDLRNGEDIAFYIRFFMRHPLKIRICPLDANATYYRAVVPGSMSRQSPSYDFNVTQRLDILERLEELHPTEEWHAVALRQLRRSVTAFIRRYLRSHPEQWPAIVADIERRRLTTVPLDMLMQVVQEHEVAQHRSTPLSLAG